MLRLTYWLITGGEILIGIREDSNGPPVGGRLLEKREYTTESMDCVRGWWQWTKIRASVVTVAFGTLFSLATPSGIKREAKKC